MTSVYLRQGDKILLLYRIGSRVLQAPSYIGTAGGHFEKDELNDARACVLRELLEETSLKENDVKNLQLRYVTLRLKDGEIRQNYYFFADVKEEAGEITSSEGELKWFKINDLPYLDMPFTAEYVLRHYINEGMNTDYLYAGVAEKEEVFFHRLEE